MSRDYYECHVTFLCEGPEPSCIPRGWKFSQICGDPDLGDGVKCYLTTQMRSSERRENVIEAVERVASKLRALGDYVLRTKVELVVYDNRTKS